MTNSLLTMCVDGKGDARQVLRVAVPASTEELNFQVSDHARVSVRELVAFNASSANYRDPRR
jgi:hypothetical protein